MTGKELIQKSRSWIKWARRVRLFSAGPVLLLYVSVHQLKEENTNLQNQREALLEKNAFLTQRLDGYGRIYDDIALPMWSKIKDSSGLTMVQVNRIYGEEILKPLNLGRLDYIGKKDAELLDPDAAELYRREDSLVLVQGRRQYFISFFQDGDYQRPIFVAKWPVYERSDTLVMGLAMDLSEILKTINTVKKNGGLPDKVKR